MTKNVFVLLISTFLVFACKKVENNAKTELDTGFMQDQKEMNDDVIGDVVKKFNNALVNQDSLQLVFLTSDNLSYGHSSGLVQNKEEFIIDILYGPFNFSMIGNPGQEIKISENIATVRHIFEAKATNDGNPVDIRIGNLQVYQRNKNGQWKLLARQAYKL